MAQEIHMVLRTEQLKHFSRLSRERFIEKSLVFFEQNFPQWRAGKNEDDLRSYVEVAIEFAERHGIKREINVQKLMYLDITHGLFGLQHDAITALLNREDLPQDRKVEELMIALNSKNYRKKRVNLAPR